MRYVLLDDLHGESYMSFLKIAFNYSDYFSISTFKSVHKKDLKETYFDFLNKVAPYKTTHDFIDLPQHYERGQKITIYRLNDDTKSAIIQAANGLYDWSIPNLPEDLSFFKRNKVWFNSITHARIAAVVNWNDTLLLQLKKFLLQQETGNAKGEM